MLLTAWMRLASYMTVDTAKQTLGLSHLGSPSKEDIARAYKRLALKHHPDLGGDNHQMVLLNIAKETLEGKRRPTRVLDQRSRPAPRPTPPQPPPPPAFKVEDWKKGDWDRAAWTTEWLFRSKWPTVDRPVTFVGINRDLKNVVLYNIRRDQTTGGFVRKLFFIKYGDLPEGRALVWILGMSGLGGAHLRASDPVVATDAKDLTEYGQATKRGEESPMLRHLKTIKNAFEPKKPEKPKKPKVSNPFTAKANKVFLQVTGTVVIRKKRYVEFTLTVYHDASKVTWHAVGDDAMKVDLCFDYQRAFSPSKEVDITKNIDLITCLEQHTKGQIAHALRTVRIRTTRKGVF